MRILVVSAQFPYPPRSGFAMRVFHLAHGAVEVVGQAPAQGALRRWRLVADPP